MALIYLCSCSAVLLVFIASNYCPVTSELVSSECVHNREDFEKSNWFDYGGQLNWAESENSLPPEFVGKLVGQQQDVFYFDLAKSNGTYTMLLNGFPEAGASTHAYLYLRYYAHSENTATVFSVAPALNGLGIPLQPAIDFKWREVLLESIPSGGSEISAWAKNHPVQSFFFIDTIMLLQGTDVLNIQDAVALCPPREPGNTPPGN